MFKKLKNSDFYVVGVGGSAGALSAFKELLHGIPNDTKAAVAIVQHLSPDAKSGLTELLSNVTHLPIAEVHDDVKIMPGHIYIIPPNKRMVMEKNVLHLLPRDGKSVNIAIDTFFVSLAKHKGHNAIGVLLSGSGTDGTLGLKAIREVGGITFAQDATAQFKSMPGSAEAAGVADYVLSPSQIANKIASIDRGTEQRRPVPYQKERIALDQVSNDDDALQTILTFVQNASNVDFSHYKPGTIKRRIERRMLLNDIKDYRQYADYLRENPGEVTSLYQDVLIKVTDFFRDPELFDFLQQKILPGFLKSKDAVRVWVPGCSTGEEVYSFAITLAELIEQSGRAIPVQIFGTDLSEDALQTARHALYPKIVEAVVPNRILQKYFTVHDSQYRLSKKIRGMCIFAKHNMIADIPFSKLDIVSSRNVLIYLDSYLQNKAFPIFHYALNPDGLLILGTAESAGNFQDLFKQIDKQHKVYVRKSTPHRFALEFPQLVSHGTVSTMRPIASHGQNTEVDIEKVADILFIKKHASAGIVVNDDLTIVLFRGDVSPYLAPASGRATLDLINMAQRSILPKILELISNAKKGGVEVKDTLHSLKTAVGVYPLSGTAAQARYFLILFGVSETQSEHVAKKSSSKRPLARETSDAIALQNELSSTIEQLQVIIEARNTSNEELRSAHEEVMSANEELQSMNEELETTKEELQSANEELMTLNAELEERNVDLERHAKELNHKDEYLSFLGHELRNPLSPILHSLEVARLHGIEDETLKEVFGIIDHQTKLLNDIIGNLLDAARAISGKIELQMEVVDFDAMVDRVVQSIKPVILAQQQTIEVHHLAHPVSTLLDPGRVEQIIVNLLNNAAKYTKSGGLILVRAEEKGGHLVLSVKDNGIGIESENLPHIFSLFYQGEQSLSNFKGGLGVGLPLASTLAKLHGGSLAATSEGSGKGSEFTLRLPIRESSRKGASAHGMDIRDLKLEKRRVMVVDDGVELADIFGKLLRQLGQDVVVAYSGAEAVPLARNHVPDIIFIDIAMPGMSGYNLIRLLKTEPGLEKTRFIALSGFGKEYVQKSLKAGFDEHIVKPVGVADLQRILSKA